MQRPAFLDHAVQGRPFGKRLSERVDDCPQFHRQRLDRRPEQKDGIFERAHFI
jgi:hypothetical protein